MGPARFPTRSYWPMGPLIVAFLSKIKDEQLVRWVANKVSRREVVTGITICPICAPTIKANAINCKHDGRDLPRFTEAIMTDELTDRIARVSRTIRRLPDLSGQDSQLARPVP